MAHPRSCTGWFRSRYMRCLSWQLQQTQGYPRSDPTVNMRQLVYGMVYGEGSGGLWGQIALERLPAGTVVRRRGTPPETARLICGRSAGGVCGEAVASPP